MDVYFFKIGLPNRSLDCSKNVITGSYFKKIWFHGESIRYSNYVIILLLPTSL